MGDPHRIKAYALVQGNTEGSLYLNELKYCITNNNGRINLIGYRINTCQNRRYATNQVEEEK